MSAFKAFSKPFNYKLLFLFIISFFPLTLFSQTFLNVKKDFGAKGDGRTDDTNAFLAAASKINALQKNVQLFIPKGNYLVKPQKLGTQQNPGYDPVSVLSLYNCSRIVIKGEKGTKITFAPSLYYGSFKHNGKQLEKLGTTTTDYKYRVAIGHGIELQHCSNVTIQSVEIDGNNRNFILGGQFGDVGIQIDNDGIFIKDGSQISLTHLNLHHFGRDGILIINETPNGFSTPSQNIVLSNCRFEYNGRQGFSWAGGVGVKANNCSFSYTGNSKVVSPPGAGVDFEPNGGYIVKNGEFTNCVFKFNSGVAVLADQGGFNVSDVQFKNCIIWGEQSAAIWVKSPLFSFTDCNINGCFYFGCAARTSNEGTQFIRCNFTDTNSKNNYLVESNGSKYLLFDQCSFRATSNGLMFIAAGAAKPEERAVIKNCRMVSYYKTRYKALAFTTGVDFTGKTIFADSGKINIGWNIEKSRFMATRGVGADISIESKYLLASYDTVTIGDVTKESKVTILPNGLLSINNNAKLAIGEEGTLVIKKGGALWIAPGAELVVKGKIIAEEGAYLCINRDAKISKQSIGNIQLNGKINFSDNPDMKYGLGGCIIVGK